jgi:hypothetical protein
MEISGETNPPLSGMAEIPANIPVQLKSNTRLTFLHYARCKLVTVIGGTLTLTSADYKEDGKIEGETDGPCPRVYSLPDDNGEGRGTGGAIFRGSAIAPRWPASLDIVFTGTRAHSVAAAAILADGDSGPPPVQLSLTGPRATPPQGTPPLRPDGRYILRLAMRDRRGPIDMPFVATAAGEAGALVVLRVD